MSKTTTSFLDSEAAKRRRIYLLCGLVVVGCVAAIFLLSSGGEPAGTSGKVDSAQGAVGGAGTGGRKPATGGTGREDIPQPIPEDVDPKRAELRAAEALFDETVQAHDEGVWSIAAPTRCP